MPDRVSARIAAAFAIVGLAAVLALSGGLFVGLRTLHQEATIASLGDLAQPALTRVGAVGAVAELRPVLATLRTDLRPDIGLYAVAGQRVVTADGGPAAADVGRIDLAGLAVGQSVGGTLATRDGSRVIYAATVVRPQGAVVGPVAVVLTAPDLSGSMALRDLVRVLPIVALITGLVAVPIAWLLARSITRPLRRLAEATAVVPAAAGSQAPLAPEGPREVRDVSLRFNAMTAELDRIRAEERELLANVRHDLKTPLTVVAGFAEALRDGTAAGPDGIARAGAAIAQEAERMGRLVADLRSMDEVGMGGALALRPEALDPAVIVRDAAARFAPRAAASQIAVRADADPGLVLAADRAAVERILGNLIENALSVVPRGGQVLVEARAAGAGADGGVALRVSDDGPGFPPGALDRAFDRFFRADPARTGPGTGLGLSIVRALARAHGGDAAAENLAPTGARITVTLPAVPARLRPG